MAVLKLLHGNSGKIVTKNQIIDAVWPGLAVTDDSLVQCIAEIRKVLGDADHTIVKTLSKRGYVYEPVNAEPQARKGTVRMQVIAAALAAIVMVSGLIAWQFFGSFGASPRPCLMRQVLQFFRSTISRAKRSSTGWRTASLKT